MRKIFYCTMLISLSLLAFSCKKAPGITIESLNKSGEEFYFGEKVPVWASTSGDNNTVSYEWNATGGTFDGFRTQNLFENLWIAPSTAGDYTITATAKNSSGGSSSRSAKLKVTRYFFDEFQSAYTLNGNGWSTSNTSNSLITNVDTASSRLELTASSTTAPNVRRNLDLSELKIPFSVRTRLGWKTYFRANSTIVISLFFNQPSNPTYPYIREIRWEIWPTVNPATTDNFQIRYETFVPATNVSKFSTVGNTAPNPLPLISPVKGRYPGLAMANGALKNLSFSIDANDVFHAYVGGELWFTSNGIKDWLAYARATYSGFQDPSPKEYRVAFPAKESNNVGTTLVMKHVYINNDNQILK
ncbi:hypothetical protein ESA94_01325 [Lacibacter luteus]|uniref:PKD domain-containing protein n=1 Tax=Lacibacter luteus TaxID=2508719 RepID=A0A4Q1CLU7_9BACT|nr:hypothetical protein [Lacibacter luteus]RXK61685.1 hypothetical protein ESA94_01325 [Lacibacter luteus]